MRRGLRRLSDINIVSSCHLNLLNCVLSRKSEGKPFHTRDPSTENMMVFMYHVSQYDVFHNLMCCRLCRLLGYSQSELIGKSLFSFHHALDAEMLDKTFRARELPLTATSV